MLIEQISAFFTSPMWAKFLFLFLLTITLTYQESRKDPELYRTFHRILLVLFIRDVLYIFVPMATVLIVSDILIFWVYMQKFRTMKGSLDNDRILLIISAVFAVFLVLNTILNLLDSAWSRVAALVVMAHYIYMGIQTYRVSEFNTDNSEMIIATRYPLLLIPILANIAFLFFGYVSDFVHLIIIPGSYFLHFIIMYQMQDQYEIESRDERNFLQNDISTIVNFMQSIGQAISARMDIDEILQTVVQSASQNTNADGGSILLIEEDDQGNEILIPRAQYGIYCPPVPFSEMVKTKLDAIRRNYESMKIPITETVLGECARLKKPIYIRDASVDERMVHNQSEDAMYVSSFMAMPIISDGKVFGVLSVVMRRNDRLFSDKDYDHMETFANYTAITMNNLFTYLELLEKQQLDKEVNIAADLQTNLLPKKIPQLPQLGLAAYSVAAKGVSGDYYDMLPLKRGKKMALLMCDVAGKGVPAALVMVIIRTIVHLIAGAENSTSRVLRWINRGIAGQVSIERYATMCYMTYDTEKYEVEYSNAAHHPLMIYRASEGKIDTYDTPGLPIGLDRKTEYGEITIKVAPGDVMCLYTDGINEAMNSSGEQFTTESIAESLRRHSQKSADEILSALMMEIEKFVAGAPQHDDQTIMIMKIAS